MASDFLNSIVRPEREALRVRNTLRAIPPVDQGADLYLLHEGRTVLNLASNNYLGLAGTPALREGAAAALDAWGTSSGASRLITGNFALYDQLEASLAAFKEQEAALVVGSGFAANLSIFSALADRSTLVFSDRLNHASIIDGIRVSGARHVRYRHNDLDHLQRLLHTHREHPRKILVTDTVFSMDGDTADLRALCELCEQYKVFTVVDEAHATGIYGQGRGMAFAQGVSRRIVLHMGTFSKAFGSYGGYIAGPREVIDLITSRGRAFVFSTALPPAVIGASFAALEEVARDHSRSERLVHISQRLRKTLHSLGLDTCGSTTHIIPVLIGENQAALQAQKLLLDRGIFVAAVRPPTVPQGTARLRISLRSDCSDRDLDSVEEAFTRCHKDFGCA
ncbi:MAG: 8-amino-7-oxononanoate synthase [Desulfovibrionales bacterium]